jgi:hypothetical protein
LQDPPKFTQIGIFGLKLNHLATLVSERSFWETARHEPLGRSRIDARAYQPTNHPTNAQNRGLSNDNNKPSSRRHPGVGQKSLEYPPLYWVSDEVSSSPLECFIDECFF